MFEARYSSGSDVQYTITVAPDGSYVSTTAIPDRTSGPRNTRIEGMLRVKDGVLLDTLTKNNDTNASLPKTSRALIVGIDDHELVLDYEKLPGVFYPTNQIVFRKQTK